MPADHKEDYYRNQGACDFYTTLSGNRTLTSVLAGNNLFICRKQRTYPPSHTCPDQPFFHFKLHGERLMAVPQIANVLSEQIISAGGEISHVQGSQTEIRLNENEFEVMTKPGQCFSSKRFISGIHPAKTLKMMESSVFRKSFFKRIINLKNTTSSFAIYIVLKERSFPYFNHNYYFHKTVDVWNDESIENWPSGYMMHTPAYEPENGFAKSMIILTSMPFEMVKKWEHTSRCTRSGEYLAFKEQCSQSLVNLAEKRFPGLRSGLVTWKHLHH